MAFLQNTMMMYCFVNQDDFHQKSHIDI